MWLSVCLGDTQGHVVDIKRRLSILRERCARLDLSYQATSEHQHLLSGINHHLLMSTPPVPRVEGVEGVVAVGVGSHVSQTDRSEHTTNSMLSMPSLVHHMNQHAPIASHHHHHNNNHHNDPSHDPHHDPSSSIAEISTVKTRASILEQHLNNTPFVSHHVTPHHSGVHHKVVLPLHFCFLFLWSFYFSYLHATTLSPSPLQPISNPFSLLSSPFSRLPPLTLTLIDFVQPISNPFYRFPILPLSVSLSFPI